MFAFIIKSHKDTYPCHSMEHRDTYPCHFMGGFPPTLEDESMVFHLSVLQTKVQRVWLIVKEEKKV